MLLFYIQGIIPLTELEQLYAQLFKISSNEVGSLLEIGKKYHYEYFQSTKGDFCTIFEIFPATNYLKMEIINTDEQAILLASDLSVALKKAIIIDGANSPSPYIWLLVDKYKYFIVEEIFPVGYQSEEYGISINWSSKMPITFPFAIRYQQKQQFAARINNKTAEITTLSTHRPLLIREKIELDFLQKIQAAHDLETLQIVENELNNTPTDPALLKQLLGLLNDKKEFY
jgi:hypothetical protein